MKRTSLSLLALCLSSVVASSAYAGLHANQIPTAHTPIFWNDSTGTYACGYKDKMPKPTLAQCTEPLEQGAPDLRGEWIDPSNKTIERIEQCGNRVIITSGHVVHDMFVTGEAAGGVFDVTTHDIPNCVVVASYGKFIGGKTLALYQVTAENKPGIPAVSRTLVDNNTIRLNYQGTVTVMKRVGTPGAN